MLRNLAKAKGGEDRIRTCGTLNRYNRLAGGPNQPLWHLSEYDMRLLMWLRRRGQDSNLRYGEPYNGFQDHRLKPLGHLSHGAARFDVARVMLAQRRLTVNIAPGLPAGIEGARGITYTA